MVIAKNDSAEGHQCEASEDDWRRVTDPRKRKQIQDRLAQRARRKRLQDAKKNAKQDLNPSAQSRDTQTDDDRNDPVPELTHQSSQFTCDAFDPSLRSNDTTVAVSSWNDPSVNSSFIPEQACMPNVFSALFANGRTLSIKCNNPVVAKSPPATLDIPLSLHPTPTQLNTVHYLDIDRFPFPKMRDNLITMGPYLDEEEFFNDLFIIPSFSITPGADPWDPTAWKIEKPFEDKWGFLFL